MRVINLSDKYLKIFVLKKKNSFRLKVSLIMLAGLLFPVLAVFGLKPLPKNEEGWKKILTSEQYNVLRKAGTERAFTGKYWNQHEKGIYRCAACGQILFSSSDKFESGTGWPSFTKPVNAKNVTLVKDSSWGMERTEVSCSRCGSHQGHVFDDGPKPTGLRYCINSISLTFEAAMK